jgi:hypothetical protein
MAAKNFNAEKARKQAEYERKARTPGTPEYVARQLRLNERTRILEREEEESRRRRRQAIASASLKTQRQVIDAILAAQAQQARR